MRTSVIAPFGIAALMLGVWFLTKRPESVEPVLDRASPEVTPPGAPPEDTTAVTVSTQRGVPGDEPGERALDAPPFRSLYQEPVFRAELVGYLVDRGLSALDSGQIVDAAIDRLSECVTSSGVPPDGRAIAVCNQNVLQQAGLDEAILRMAAAKAGSQMSRRLAVEGARGFEVGVAVSFRERTN